MVNFEIKMSYCYEVRNNFLLVNGTITSCQDQFFILKTQKQNGFTTCHLSSDLSDRTYKMTKNILLQCETGLSGKCEVVKSLFQDESLLQSKISRFHVIGQERRHKLKSFLKNIYISSPCFSTSQSVAGLTQSDRSCSSETDTTSENEGSRQV